MGRALRRENLGCAEVGTMIIFGVFVLTGLGVACCIIGIILFVRSMWRWVNDELSGLE